MAAASTVATIQSLVGEVLSLPEGGKELSESSLLLGEIPEFDSMSIVSVIAAIEEQYQIEIPDDELTAEVFESVGSLAEFVDTMRAA